MSSEKQVVLDVEPAQVMVSREKVSSGWSGSWKILMAVMAVTLCTAAAVFFTFNKMENKAGETDDIRHTLRQVSSSAKAAIHLSGRYNEKMSDSVEWKDNEDQSFKEGGLRLENNEIHIPRDGLYFVYSQVSYRVSCSFSSDENAEEATPIHLSHMVSRWSESYSDNKPLLSAVRSACKKSPSVDGDSEQPWFSAVYVGAVFKLQAGDRLNTIMKYNPNLSQVEGQNGKTFFGVFSL
ncbi:tumor necrosis factor a (TNF superfamily, member 2) [Hoplias malabaricus]|uniref:tumor necrosis factor a (TNF superfamily, member 2) n=1 Tax=Hoplias malabaricus TaxID=27720 RepID=UPI0034631D20